MDTDREISNVFTIPANYTDSGKLFGGMLETRNTIEAGMLVIAVGYPELMWMRLPIMMKIIVMTVTLLPISVIALMGVSGGSLFQYIFNIIKFWIRRRKLHFRRIGFRYENTKKRKKTKAAIRTGLHPGKGDP